MLRSGRACLITAATQTGPNTQGEQSLQAHLYTRPNAPRPSIGPSLTSSNGSSLTSCIRVQASQLEAGHHSLRLGITAWGLTRSSLCATG